MHAVLTPIVLKAHGVRLEPLALAHVDGLIARGWLVKKDNSARTLEVVSPDHDSLARVGVIANTTEQEILKKIDELKGIDNDKHAKEIETLVEALNILGYQASKETFLA